MEMQMERKSNKLATLQRISPRSGINLGKIPKPMNDPELYYPYNSNPPHHTLPLCSFLGKDGNG